MRLRPVQMGGAAFILWLRNPDHVRGKVGDSAADVTSQEEWLKKYFEREGDYYFIVETLGGIPLGTHGIYDVKGGKAEIGRHIIRPEVFAGVPSAILTTELGFGRLGLSELRSTVVSSNVKVISFHRRCGAKQVGILRSAQTIGGRSVDLVEFVMTSGKWFKVRSGLFPLAQLAGDLVRDWERSQEIKVQRWMRLRKAVCLPLGFLAGFFGPQLEAVANLENFAGFEFIGL